MAGKYLLDTNIVIASFAADPGVLEHLRTADTAIIPSIVFGELYYGAQRSSRVQSNLGRLDELATQSPQVPCNLGTAQRYGIIKQSLRTRGRPLPENDIWVAAIAIQHSLTLVTRDQHFSEIEGLRLERWQPYADSWRR